MITRRIVDNVDNVAVIAEQDVQAILDHNKQSQADPGRGYTPSRDLRKVAEIPLIVAELWKNTLGVDVFDKNHAPAVRRLLNDPDWLWLRSAPGRV